MDFSKSSDSMRDYLQPTEVVDSNHPLIQSLAQRLSLGCNDDIETARAIYHYVRDKIAHSGDIDASFVTCSASEVLAHGHGVCCAKAHLLAALWRVLGIPAGLCYQWLVSDDDSDQLVIHGLNAVYLKSVDRWIRLDARGNKVGVNAEFCIDNEQLAWPVRNELGEYDEPVIYHAPKTEVIQSLTEFKDRHDPRRQWVCRPRRMG